MTSLWRTGVWTQRCILEHYNPYDRAVVWKQRDCWRVQWWEPTALGSHWSYDILCEPLVVSSICSSHINVTLTTMIGCFDIYVLLWGMLFCFSGIKIQEIAWGRGTEITLSWVPLLQRVGGRS